jgi:hypothetical protein
MKRRLEVLVHDRRGSPNANPLVPPIVASLSEGTPGIYGHVVSPGDQTSGEVLCEGFKSPISSRDAAGAENCDLHMRSLSGTARFCKHMQDRCCPANAFVLSPLPASHGDPFPALRLVDPWLTKGLLEEADEVRKDAHHELLVPAQNLDYYPTGLIEHLEIRSE